MTCSKKKCLSIKWSLHSCITLLKKREVIIFGVLPNTSWHFCCVHGQQSSNEFTMKTFGPRQSYMYIPSAIKTQINLDFFLFLKIRKVYFFWSKWAKFIVQSIGQVFIALVMYNFGPRMQPSSEHLLNAIMKF